MAMLALQCGQGGALVSLHVRAQECTWQALGHCGKVVFERVYIYNHSRGCQVSDAAGGVRCVMSHSGVWCFVSAVPAERLELSLAAS